MGRASIVAKLTEKLGCAPTEVQIQNYKVKKAAKKAAEALAADAAASDAANQRKKDRKKLKAATVAANAAASSATPPPPAKKQKTTDATAPSTVTTSPSPAVPAAASRSKKERKKAAAAAAAATAAAATATAAAATASSTEGSSSSAAPPPASAPAPPVAAAAPPATTPPDAASPAASRAFMATQGCDDAAGDTDDEGDEEDDVARPLEPTADEMEEAREEAAGRDELEENARMDEEAAAEAAAAEEAAAVTEDEDAPAPAPAAPAPGPAAPAVTLSKKERKKAAAAAAATEHDEVGAPAVNDTSARGGLSTSAGEMPISASTGSTAAASASTGDRSASARRPGLGLSGGAEWRQSFEPAVGEAKPSKKARKKATAAAALLAIGGSAGGSSAEPPATAAAADATTLSTADLEAAARAVLASADLSSITGRSARAGVEAHLGLAAGALTGDRKKELKAIIDQVITTSSSDAPAGADAAPSAYAAPPAAGPPAPPAAAPPAPPAAGPPAPPAAAAEDGSNVDGGSSADVAEKKKRGRKEQELPPGYVRVAHAGRNNSYHSPDGKRFGTVKAAWEAYEAGKPTSRGSTAKELPPAAAPRPPPAVSHSKAHGSGESARAATARAATPWNLFLREQLPLLRAAQPGLTHAQAMCMVGESWKASDQVLTLRLQRSVCPLVAVLTRTPVSPVTLSCGTEPQEWRHRPRRGRRRSESHPCRRARFQSRR